MKVEPVGDQDLFSPFTSTQLTKALHLTDMVTSDVTHELTNDVMFDMLQLQHYYIPACMDDRRKVVYIHRNKANHKSFVTMQGMFQSGATGLHNLKLIQIVPAGWIVLYADNFRLGSPDKSCLQSVRDIRELVQWTGNATPVCQTNSFNQNIIVNTLRYKYNVTVTDYTNCFGPGSSDIRLMPKVPGAIFVQKTTQNKEIFDQLLALTYFSEGKSLVCYAGNATQIGWMFVSDRVCLMGGASMNEDDVLAVIHRSLKH